MPGILSGSHPQTIDDRGRLAVPARLMADFRALAGPRAEGDIEVVVTVSPQSRVGVYPKVRFKEMISLLEELEQEDRDMESLRLNYLNYAEEQSLDKQNRFRVPALLAESFNLAGEVVVVGSGDFLEVISKAEWKAQLDANRAQMGAQAARMKALLRERRQG